MMSLEKHDVVEESMMPLEKHDAVGESISSL